MEDQGRVTRLRKRLGADTEQHIQPEAEISSPARRVTRRNSMCGTPIAGTPTKTPAKTRPGSALAIAITPEVNNSPRSVRTRRRMHSVSEDDHPVKASGASKAPFDAVIEENGNDQKVLLEPPVTRSKSKSPLQKLTTPNDGSEQKRTKIGPKSKTIGNTKKEPQSDSEVEIITLGSDGELEEIKKPETELKTPLHIQEVLKLPLITPTFMSKIKKDVDSTSTSPKASDKRSVGFNSSPEPNKAKSTYPKTPAPTKSYSYRGASTPMATEASTEQKNKSNVSVNESEDSFHDASNKIEAQTKDEIDLIVSYDALEEEDAAEESAAKNKSYVNDNDSLLMDCDAKSSLLRTTVQSSTPIVHATIATAAETPKSTVCVVKPSPQRKSIDLIADKENIVGDAFETVRMSPLWNKNTSVNSLIQGTTPKGKQSETPNRMINTSSKTPTSAKVETPKQQTPSMAKIEAKVETPKQQTPSMASTTKGKSAESEDVFSTNSVEPMEVDDDSLDLVNANKVVANEPAPYATSWSQCISGHNGSIDAIKGGANAVVAQTDKLESIIDEEKAATPSKSALFSREDVDPADDDDNDNESDMMLRQEDDEEEPELTEGEIPYKKHSFVDDEAMDAGPDYESGDSMDESELREREENEISEQGESIGSEDTDVGDDDEDEGDEGDDASFIVSEGEEENAEFSDDEDEMLESEGDVKKNKYKRIKMLVESDEDEEHETVEAKEKAEENEEDNDVEDEENKSLSKRKSQSIVEIFDDSVVAATSPNKEGGVVTRKSLNKSAISNANESINDGEEENTLESKEDNQDDKTLENNLNTSKLSDAAKRLHSSLVSEQSDVLDEEDVQQLNASRKKILKDLNQSDRFNKTVMGRDIESPETSTDTVNTTVATIKEASKTGRASMPGSSNRRRSIIDIKANLSNSMMECRVTTIEFKGQNVQKEEDTSDDEETKEEPKRATQRKSLMDQNQSVRNCFDDESSESTNSDEERHGEHFNSDRHSQHSISEEQAKTDASDMLEYDDDGDGNVESNDQKVKFGSPLKRKSIHGCAALSKSFVHVRDAAVTDKKRHSFTIGVSVKGNMVALKRKEKLTTGSFDASSPDEGVNDADDSMLDAEPENDNTSMTSNDSTEAVQQQLENIKKLELVSKYLANERRKSLALPPVTSIDHDEEEAATRKKSKRKSLGLPIDEDFNPSKSLVECIAEHKRELRSVVKRKRLSKSFSGALGEDDTSICQHLHKKSKMSTTLLESSSPERQDDEDQEEDGEEEDKEKVVPISKLNDDNNNKTQKILQYCDEMLEAANRAKLEAKLQASKNKGPNQKKAKRNKKTKVVQQKSSETSSDDNTDAAAKEEQRNKAIEHALETAKGILCEDGGKHKKSKHTKMQRMDSIGEDVPQHQNNSKRLPKQFLEAISGGEAKNKKKPQSKVVLNEENDDDGPSTSKKAKKRQQLASVSDEQENTPDIYLKNKTGACSMKNAAGKVIETPLTPIKKKIRKMQIASGVVREEPLTPKLSNNRTGFRDSPVTPKTTAFKVRQILMGGQDTPPTTSVAAIENKRRRNKRRMEEPQRVLPKPQWTRSGVFMEEELPMAKIMANSLHQELHGVRDGRVYKAKKKQASAPSDWKKLVQNRKDILRESTRELLQRKERSLAHKRF